MYMCIYISIWKVNIRWTIFPSSFYFRPSFVREISQIIIPRSVENNCGENRKRRLRIVKAVRFSVAKRREKKLRSKYSGSIVLSPGSRIFHLLQNEEPRAKRKEKKRKNKRSDTKKRARSFARDSSLVRSFVRWLVRDEAKTSRSFERKNPLFNFPFRILFDVVYKSISSSRFKSTE